ncbi:MAG: glycogen synthase, partial [Treponemataceae bacterium]
MKILMATSETVPFAKSGGLADVVSALSKELKKRGHDVRIVMPRYYKISRQDLQKLPAPLGVPVGFGEIWNGVYEGVIPATDVPIYFLDNEALYGREGIYGESGGSYPDNALRFINLSRGIFQLCKMLDWYPDIIHTHDWPTSTAAMILNTWEKDGYFTKTASVLTIHNLGYQGWFPKEDLHLFQLQWSEFYSSGLEKNDSLNFLKCGIMNSDAITTVSPTYANEIQGICGEGLQGELSIRKNDLYGILNGMDYDEWNPKTDCLIPHNFSASKMDGKKKMKALLQEKFNLPIDQTKPLFGIVSRFAEQKGFGALCGPSHGSLYNICNDMDIQVIILGTGEKWCENELTSLASRLDNLRVFVGFNNELAHWIEAGCDFFLMPSAYEPCGLNQMYSLA